MKTAVGRVEGGEASQREHVRQHRPIDGVTLQDPARDVAVVAHRSAGGFAVVLGHPFGRSIERAEHALSSIHRDAPFVRFISPRASSISRLSLRLTNTMAANSINPPITDSPIPTEPLRRLAASPSP